MLTVRRLDHLVLTCRDVAATIRFYTEVLGIREITFGNGRKALAFGQQKLNLHPVGGKRGQAQFPMPNGGPTGVAHEIEPGPFPIAARPTPGSADLCLIVAQPLDVVAAHLAACGVPVEEGPVIRTGALGPIESVYIRDPDGNLVELSRYLDG